MHSVWFYDFNIIIQSNRGKLGTVHGVCKERRHTLFGRVTSDVKIYIYFVIWELELSLTSEKGKTETRLLSETENVTIWNPKTNYPSQNSSSQP